MFFSRIWLAGVRHGVIDNHVQVDRLGLELGQAGLQVGDLDHIVDQGADPAWWRSSMRSTNLRCSEPRNAGCRFSQEQVGIPHHRGHRLAQLLAIQAITSACSLEYTPAWPFSILSSFMFASARSFCKRATCLSEGRRSSASMNSGSSPPPRLRGHIFPQRTFSFPSGTASILRVPEFPPTTWKKSVFFPPVRNLVVRPGDLRIVFASPWSATAKAVESRRGWARRELGRGVRLLAR